jgi:hypothetical protein
MVVAGHTAARLAGGRLVGACLGGFRCAGVGTVLAAACNQTETRKCSENKNNSILNRIFPQMQIMYNYAQHGFRPPPLFKIKSKDKNLASILQNTFEFLKIFITRGTAGQESQASPPEKIQKGARRSQPPATDEAAGALSARPHHSLGTLLSPGRLL